MNYKTIICDIDSTLSNHWKRIREYSIPKWPGDNIDPKAFGREAVLTDSLLPGCCEVLWLLHREGFLIRYLTARGWPFVVPITEEQLKGWDLPTPQDFIVCNNMAKKVEILDKDICDYYIDDFMTGQENNIGTFHHGIARAIQSKGVKVIVFRNDWFDVLEQIRIYENS